MSTACLHHLLRLGDYDSDRFTDDRVDVPLAKFQEAIEEIGEDLEIE